MYRSSSQVIRTTMAAKEIYADVQTTWRQANKRGDKQRGGHRESFIWNLTSSSEILWVCFSLFGSFVYTRAEYTYESMCFAVHAVGDCCLASGFTPWYAREKLFTSPAIMGSFCEGCHERVRFCCRRLFISIL
ncbi:unnamed protein product [Pylaiella littoralis]